MAPPWVFEPILRGTSSILWSCITTLVACVYTALHLNVPKNTGAWSILKLKAFWVIIALLAPEIVVYMAMSQLLTARKLKKDLKELLGDDCGVNLEFCFFVVMGGLEIKSLHPQLSVQERRPFLSVSPEMVLWSARLQLPLPVEMKRIQDKSKADLLQKCLVLLQVTWMAVQSITRKILGLPLAILEVHTLVHVICAAVMYAFWLKKPMDVREPERLYLGDTWRQSIAAAFSERELRSLEDHRCLYVIPQRVEGSGPVAPRIKLPPPGNPDIVRHAEQFPGQLPLEVEVLFRWNSEDSGFLQRGEALPCGLANMGDVIEFDGRLLAHWTRVLNLLDQGLSSHPRAQANELYSVLDAQVPKASVGNPNLRFSLTELLEASLIGPLNLPFRETIMSSILPGIYGGIHLAVLTFDFPSSIESFLWRCSAAYIVSGLYLWQVLQTIMLYLKPLRLLDKMLGCLGCSNTRWDESIWTYFRGIAMGIFVLLYTLARTFIIVESFISLRYMPIGVYLTPRWIQMIPHI